MTVPARRAARSSPRGLPASRRSGRSRLLDLDRLAPRRRRVLGFVDAADPEIHDRADAQELLAAGIPKMPARLRRHDSRHEPAAALAEIRLRLELADSTFELGETGVRFGHGALLLARI